MKTKLQKTIELENIIDAFEGTSLKEAKSILDGCGGATIEITGTVSKIAKRDDLLRLVVETNSNGRQMSVIANFDDGARTEIERFKIKKGSAVSLTGLFQSAGTNTTVLSKCYLSI